MILLYAGCVIVTGVLAVGGTRVLRRVVRHVRVGRDLAEVHRAVSRERGGAAQRPRWS